MFLRLASLVFLTLGGSRIAVCGDEGEASALVQGEDALLAGVVRAVAYSGFRDGQHPDRGEGAIFPSDEEIVEDLEILQSAEFGLIRLYDSGQNSADVLRLIRRHGFPMKVMLGVWLKGELSNHEGCSWVHEPVPDKALAENKLANREEIERGIELANTYSEVVVAVNVGNEALVTWNDHLVADDAMLAYLKEVADRIQQPVTTADNYKVFAEKGATFEDALDFAAVHSYPQWEGKSVEDALAFTVENLLEVRNAMPNTPIVISEAGWATVGSEFGERASEAAQERYFRELLAFCEQHRITLFWFEAFDEPWKGDPGNARGAEKHWGLFQVDRRPKQAMRSELIK